MCQIKLMRRTVVATKKLAPFRQSDRWKYLCAHAGFEMKWFRTDDLAHKTALFHYMSNAGRGRVRERYGRKLSVP